jgi:hypothetical protein
MISIHHGIQNREKRLVKAIDESRIGGNTFRNLQDIVVIAGLFLKNYFDDMSLDWEDCRKASAEIW